MSPGAANELSAPRTVIVDGRSTRELRRRVLRPHLTSTDVLPGDDVTDAVHFAILGDHGTPISACFLFVEGYPWPPDDAAGTPPTDVTPWHLRSVATEAGMQGRRLGTVLLQDVLRHVAQQGGGVLWCNARTPALSFYHRLGLVAHGGEHMSGNPPLAHYYMWRTVEAQASA